MADKGEVVLVTGASGFLGQYIIKLIQEKDDDVVEIRTLDTKPCINTLGFKEKKPMNNILGDVRDLDTVVKACRGVHCVIHTAAVISFGRQLDMEGMQSTNIIGTENVIEACIRACVPRIVFTSTVDVVVGKQQLINVKETQAPIPDRFLIPGYPETKYQAEVAILAANGRLLSDDSGFLHTLALRPVVMYGEGDPYYVTSILRSAEKRGGVLTQVGDGISAIQQVYVGNAAWAHLVAKRALRDNPEGTSGLPYFITDDTLPTNVFNFVDPFLKVRGMRLSEKRIPYWVMWILFTLMDVVVMLMNVIRAPIPPSLQQTTLASITYMCNTYVVNRMRATFQLNYHPIYSPLEALERSLPFYSNIKLNEN